MWGGGAGGGGGDTMRKRVFGHKRPAKTKIHPHSLIMVFTVDKRNHWILHVHHACMESKGPDDTLFMCKMI